MRVSNKNIQENIERGISKNAILYICPTPIGNLGDISKRLAAVLCKADIVYAEDTRVTAKLLTHIGSKARLQRLDQNVIDKRCVDVINAVKAGKICAYCTDAGSPGVSDPGLTLVAEARNAGVNVEVLPGPCAAISAYIASGFDNPRFYFVGFFGRKKSEVVAALDTISMLDAVAIFYESPNRLLKTLSTIKEYFDTQNAEKAQPQISVCRELTKLHEEVVVGTPAEVYSTFAKRDAIKGEIVVCVDASGGQTEQRLSSTDTKNIASTIKLITLLKKQGMRDKQSANIAAEMYDISKSEAYNIALEIGDCVSQN